MPTVLPPARRAAAGLLSIAAALLLPPAVADTAADEPTVHQIRMLNSGPSGRFVFEPPVTFAEPGDIVRFVAADSGHGSFSISEMLPEGAEDWRSGIGGLTEVVLEVEGVYGFRCLAHYSVGMAGMVVVGDPRPNLDAARAVGHPARAQERFDALFEVVEERQRRSGR